VFHEKLINRIEMLNLTYADLIVVVSEEMQEELIQRGIDKNKILINPNGVDTSVYSPDVDGTTIRTKYFFNKSIVLGFIGTFGKWHGAEVLTQAFGMLLNEKNELRNKVKLLLIGDGVTMPEVKKYIETYNINQEVILTGQIPQIEGPAHLAACDILVSPHIPTPDGTKFFGSPTKLFEYMAMGKPIIASDLNQIGRILEQHKTAILCEPGNPVALKDAISNLVDDKELCILLGKNARDKAVNEFTWQKNVEKVIEKYNEIKKQLY
jgi:glycosyltransferase involved in cell wall biosynthesis